MLEDISVSDSWIFNGSWSMHTLSISGIWSANTRVRLLLDCLQSGRREQVEIHGVRLIRLNLDTLSMRRLEWLRYMDISMSTSQSYMIALSAIHCGYLKLAVGVT